MSSSSCVDDPYLQLSLYVDVALDPVPAALVEPKSEPDVFDVLRLKKFMPFIMFEEPIVLENVDADKAA
jgi:hypothetical protein